MRLSFLKKTLAAALLGAVSLLAVQSTAGAQAYPSQDIRFICAFPPGSGADVLVRYFANAVQKVSGHTIVVENKAGAAGLIATEYVVRSKPDGYTIFVHAGSAVSNIPALYAKPPFDARNALEVAATINRQPFMILVDAKSPYQTLDQLTEAMKKKGDKASYATAATTGKVMGEIYKARTGIQAVEVEYKTAPDSINDMLSGRLDYAAHDPVFALAQAREGRMRILGVSTGERLKANPDMKTMKEQGVDMDLTGWWAAMVPIGTNKEAKAKITEWFNKAVNDPETVKFLNSFGGDPLTETPEAGQARLLKDIDLWIDYAKVAKIVPQ
jgi:tripartite-type tricarboxylate transporter receptor subunit TctC